MTPFLLAQEHPRLWHLTAAEAKESIFEHGLLSTADILDRWEVASELRDKYMTAGRKLPIPLYHANLGSVVINDNAPLSEKKLAPILDDDLTVADWLRMLNSRVFFFTNRNALKNLSDAALNRDRPKIVLEICTHTIAEAYGTLMEIVPINSGSTIHTPPRRGKATFAPLVSTDYFRWQRQRGMKQHDTIKEVAVRGSIPDIARFVLSIHDCVPL